MTPSINHVVLLLVVALTTVQLRGTTPPPTTRSSMSGELSAFRFKGDPIHPACVKMLGTELQNALPSVAAVDIDGATQNATGAMKRKAEWVRIDLDGGEWFAYRHVGASRVGIHILETRESGGGTGVFSDLLFVRLSVDAVMDTERRQRVTMTRLGSFVLGDRDEGAIRLEGDRLFVGRSRYRASDTVIDVGHLR